MKTPNYHTQHAPFGAFASFTLGLLDAPGGFGQSLGGPANQNLYIGYRRSSAPTWQILPYYQRQASQEGNFQEIAQEFPAGPGITRLAPDQFTRRLGWCSSIWQADEDRFAFGLVTPVTEIPEPTTMRRTEARRFLAPAICGWIEYDNRAGKEPVELMFGFGNPAQPPRTFEDPGLVGFASGTAHGFATVPTRDVVRRQGFDLFPSKYSDHRGLHAIGAEAALVWKVPAGKRKRFPLALGFYQAGPITTGIDAEFYYTRLFENLEDVLSHALDQHAWYSKLATQRDRELAASGLTPDQQFLVAQATHSYLGSTELLWTGRQPLWVVNEGEYRMMNTFDLTVDHLFYELRWHPWTIRNTLDLFVSRYAYTDRIKVGDRAVRGGLAFTHDMGVMNQFTPAGHSSYECDRLHGCFSHMTMEQLLNWVLSAVTYAERMDEYGWLRRHRATLDACVESLHRRDHPDARLRDGILKFDSDRCGENGAEITTYDSLDVSLGQARNNLYLAVKTLGAWLLLERAYTRLKADTPAVDARATADRLVRSLTGKFETGTGFFPAVFEAGNTARIIPAVEGLAYPLYLGLLDDGCRARLAPLMPLLEQHLTRALQPGICLDADTGGWKMSSTSTNTWFSKIALCQWVVAKLFPQALSPAAKAADAVHAEWQRQPGCGAFAMCDQIRSNSGITCGSRYYPRGVTTILWLG